MTSIFERIIRRELPARVFYETDEVIVIEDIRPRAEVHLLLIPKTVTRNFYETPDGVLTMLNQTVRTVADKLQINEHFRIIINNGYGQEVEHLHYHFQSDRGWERLKFL
ncbi:MAG: HIT domain-containing protein [Candidatus Zixiibacteriota bacterium]